GLIGFGFGMGGVKRLRNKRADNKVMTILGVIVSVLAVVLGVVGMIIVQHAVDQLQTDLNNIDATYNTKEIGRRSRYRAWAVLSFSFLSGGNHGNGTQHGVLAGQQAARDIQGMPVMREDSSAHCRLLRVRTLHGRGSGARASVP